VALTGRPDDLGSRGGKIFDQDSDGKLDTVALLGENGVVASVPWPLK